MKTSAKKICWYHELYVYLSRSLWFPNLECSRFSEEDEKPLAILHHLGGIPQGGGWSLYKQIYTPFTNHHLGCVKLPGCKTYCWFSEILHHMGYIKTVFFYMRKNPHINWFAGFQASAPVNMRNWRNSKRFFSLYLGTSFHWKFLYIYSEVRIEKNVWIFLKKLESTHL